MSPDSHYDVVILGAGIAGLTLARQLLMYSDKTVLLLEKRPQSPPERQKVGECSVQVQGYYLSKVLDLEEHLLREHFLKYNLRSSSLKASASMARSSPLEDAVALSTTPRTTAPAGITN